MSDAMRFTFPKEARERAKTEKKALFACCLDGRPAKRGGMSMYGPCDADQASDLFMFAFHVRHNRMTPKAAFEKVYGAKKATKKPAKKKGAKA